MCVCLYGLVQRSLHLTLEHYKEFVFSDDCDLYIHTFDSEFAYSPRENGETEPVKISLSNVLKLKAKKCLIESEKDFNENFDFKKFEKYGDTFNNNFVTLRNLLREIYSVQKVYELIDKNEKYESVIMTRADLCFDKKIKNIKLDNSKDFIITSKFNRSPMDLNDFFAIGSNVKALEIWANRLDYAEEYCENSELGALRGLHAESLVRYCVETYNIRNVLFDVKVDRVRADGKVIR